MALLRVRQPKKVIARNADYSVGFDWGIWFTRIGTQEKSDVVIGWRLAN